MGIAYSVIARLLGKTGLDGFANDITRGAAESNAQNEITRNQQSNLFVNSYTVPDTGLGQTIFSLLSAASTGSAEAAPPVIALSAPVDPGLNAQMSTLGTPDGIAVPRSSPPTASTPTEFLVQFNAGVGVDERNAILSSASASLVEIVNPADANGGELVLVRTLPDSSAVALATLSNAPAVRFAEPNWSLGVQAYSNDTYYTNGSMWGMYGDATSPKNIYGSQAGEAWAAGFVGSSKIVVGDVDTGIDYTHPDIYLNVWLNQGELPSNMALTDVDADGLITFRDLNNSINSSFVSDLNQNGRIDAGDLLKDRRWADGFDQDRNGLIDDLIGWDFVNNDNDPYDDNGHGTHTAGTIGAMGGNGAGVAGVNWNTQIMGLKFLSGSGSGSIAGAIKAIDYYTRASALDQTRGWSSEFIGTNNSWGGGGYSQSLGDAITRGAYQGALFVAAAGNGGSDGVGDNNDAIGNYPSNYSTLASVGYEAVVAVAATTSSGGLASYSNYGVTTVDLGAPGSGIVSTVPGGGYASYSGTSMATPHVTGALALYASQNPSATASQLRSRLLASTSPLASLAGKTVTGGILDIGKMLSGSSGGTPPSDTLAPALSSASPADDATGVAVGANLVMTFSESVRAGSGNILIYDNTDAVARTISVSDSSQVSFSGNIVTINPATDLAPGSGYYVNMASGVITDLAGNNYAGISGSTAWNFTTGSSNTSGVTLYGTDSNDTLTGTGYADLLSGVPVTGSRLGIGTIDTLTGGLGNDLFILGDARGRFYDDLNKNTSGKQDYALITDFQVGGDKIQLFSGYYFLSSTLLNGVSGTGIYFDSNANRSFGNTDELIGLLRGVSPSSLSSNNFTWV